MSRVTCSQCSIFSNSQVKVICWKLYFTTVCFLYHQHHSHSACVLPHLPADIGQHKWVHETKHFTRVRKDDGTLVSVHTEPSGTRSPFPEFGIHRHLSFLLRWWRLPGLANSWHLFPRGHLGNGCSDRVGQLRLLGCVDSWWELNLDTHTQNLTSCTQQQVLHQFRRVCQKLYGSQITT